MYEKTPDSKNLWEPQRIAYVETAFWENNYLRTEDDVEESSRRDSRNATRTGKPAIIRLQQPEARCKPKARR
jgi:hypothetical protein